MSTFWDTWRKDIIRGAALFCAVLVVWWVGKAAVSGVRRRVTESLPMALRDLPHQFDADFDAGPRTTGGTWNYRARVEPKQWVWIHNIRGSVKVEPTKGSFVDISAVKTYHSSDPASVQLVATPYEGGVAVCAVWQGRSERCSPKEGDYNMRGPHRNDVAVDFTVQLPATVRLGATTVVGDLHVTGARAPLVLHTVSGDVDATTAAGPVQARSVNGDVRIHMDALGDTGAVSVVTINGSVTAELPPQLDADVKAKTINGSITTDYPLQVNGKFTSHDVAGTLGKGGREVSIQTVNGSIKLNKATSVTTPR